MQSIEIDRGKRLRDQPHTGHNRWHPEVEPKIEVEEGEEVVLQTRDASDGLIPFGSTVKDLVNFPRGVVHPLTGPVYIKGAAPGDLLEIEYLDIIPESYGYTRFGPNVGFLKDLYTDPFMVHWVIDKGFATSDALPGVCIPAMSFMGTDGLAPSHGQLVEWNKRESELVSRNGNALIRDPIDAVPDTGPIATDGLRTMPPRENCGNADVKQLTKGSRLYIPVSVYGGLYSVGDAHFAQGDGEVCVTAIEMGATCRVRFKIHKDEARTKNIRWPRFAHSGFFGIPGITVPGRFSATMGMPIDHNGVNDGENLTLACRNALLNMIDLLQERGWDRNQAYIICSVAVDLRISNVVDVPNYVVSAILPEDIFDH